MAGDSMNIDRPLEDIIKEQRVQKRTDFKGKKKPKGKPKGPQGDNMDTSDVGRGKSKSKKRGAISMKVQSGGVKKASTAKTKKRVPVGAFKAAAVDAGLTSFTGTKMQISNLGPAVTEADLNELFSEMGPLEKVKILFDKNHRSSGNAFVIFKNRNDALEAIKNYNNVPLDRKPLNLSLARASASKSKPNGGATSGAPVIKIKSNRRNGRQIQMRGDLQASTKKKSKRPGGNAMMDD